MDKHDELHKDPNHWFMDIFYVNPRDKHIFTRRRIKGPGWTVNFGNPITILVLIGLLMFIFVVLAS